MKIQKVIFFILLSLFRLPLDAQTSDTVNFNFTTIRELDHTGVKDQYHTQTCWSFSALSFFESEMLRSGKPEVDLSEMFIVNHCYQNKAQKYIRMQGKINFGPGGIFYDVLDVISNYGLVPEDVYRGIKSGEGKHDHKEMDEDLKKKIDEVAENKGSKISPDWAEAFNKTIDSYLGEIPESFRYKGHNYTPKSFAMDYCAINPDDYVQITSFSHHPYYKPFILEVPDNWIWSDFYNVPLDVLQQIVDSSLAKGYTVAWAADVTDKGFATTKKGLAVVPDEENTDLSGTLISSNAECKPDKEDSLIIRPSELFKEKTISQEIRQTAFDDQETTDDHGMHIIGLAKDQNGRLYYKVKNSWGNYNNNDGYFYASAPYLRYKTTSIMVNKNAIPESIRTKLGF